MSIFGTIVKDGVEDGIGLVPKLYLIGGSIVLIGALITGGKIWFDHKVDAAANIKINAFIAKQTKTTNDTLQEIQVGAQKIQIQYVDRVQVVTKTVTVNHDVIRDKVPDTKVILSDGWVSAYNSSVAGMQIDPTAASVVTPSGVTAVDALDTVNDNNGSCLKTQAQLTALQTWIIQSQADVAAANKKNKVKTK